MTKVYLYSDQYQDHSILATGLQAVLMSAGGFQFECLAGTVPELTARLAHDVPDVLLLELSQSAVGGTLRDVKAAAPSCKPVLWAAESISTELAFLAMSLGIRGILRKSLPTELLLTCLHKVHAGELWFEKALVDNLATAKRVPLSPRERQLITLLSHGLKNKEIGAALRITEGTVKVYLSRLFEKVGVQDRFELAVFGLKNLCGAEWQTVPGNNACVSGVPNRRPERLERPRIPLYA